MTRRVELQAPRSAEDELKIAIARPVLADGRDGWRWIAAQAGLGRMYTEARQHDKAATACRELSGFLDKFPEAGIGLHQVAAGFEAEGDGLLKSRDRGLLEEAIAAYESGLRQAEAIEGKTNSLKEQKRDIVDSLASKLAVALIGWGDERSAQHWFDRLSEQWWREGERPGGESWGPYYYAQKLAKPILARPDLRYSLTNFYQLLLANAPHIEGDRNLKDARDLTAALLDLYSFVRPETKAVTGDAGVQGGALDPADQLNVVTPLAIEMSEELLRLMECEDETIRESSTLVVDDFKEVPALASKLKNPQRPVDNYLAGQLSSDAKTALADYESFVSDPVPLATGLIQTLGQIIGGPCIFEPQRFAGVELRTKTNRLLSQEPKNDDLRHLNVLLLEDAYSQELSRNALGRYAGAVRRRVEANFGVRIPGLRVRSSPDLQGTKYRILIHEQVIAERACKNEQLEEMFLHLETTIAANLADFVGHQEIQNYLERNKLVVATVEDISEKEHCSHMDPLTAVIRSLVMERVPLTEPKAIYEVFRAGWKAGIAISAIAECVRRIPNVQAKLWGNDGKHTYVLLPSSVEITLTTATRKADRSDYLVMKKSERDSILAAIGKTVDGLACPALIARRQEQRALVRQLITTRYPDVPLLASCELPSTVDKIMEMPEFDQ